LNPLWAVWAFEADGSVRACWTDWTLNTLRTCGSGRALGSIRSSIPLWAFWTGLTGRSCGSGVTCDPLGAFWSRVAHRAFRACWTGISLQPLRAVWTGYPLWTF